VSLNDRRSHDTVCWWDAAPLPMTREAMSIEPIPHPLLTVAAAGALGRRTADADARAAEPAEDAGSAEPVPARLADVPPLEAVQVAAKAYEELRRADRELHFETSEEGVLRIEVYDGTGKLLRTIPPNEVLAITSREVAWRA